VLGGDLPPHTGPEREAHLLDRGLTAWAHARRSYGVALRQTAVLTDIHYSPWRPLSHRSPRVVGEQIIEAQHRWRRETQDRARGRLRMLVESGQDIAEIYDSERHARRALSLVVAAYNYLEDTSLAEPLHEFAHQVAAFVNGLFCCPLIYEDGIYWRECPLAMMHLRFGSSPEVISRQLCSVCGLDSGDCVTHAPGQTYLVVARLVEDEVCSCCWRSNCADHVLGQQYPVRAYVVRPDFRAVNFSRIAVVDRPRDPLARWSRIEFPTLFLETRLGYRPTGEPQECFYCIEPCKGMFTAKAYFAGRDATSFNPGDWRSRCPLRETTSRRRVTP
jgi:hypothetical protein